MRRAHLLVGLPALAAFALQGRFMRHVLHVGAMLDGPRLLYRSAHIYLMFAGALNLLVAPLPPGAGGWRRTVRLVGSALLLAAPALFVGVFLVEAGLPGLRRPWAQAGVFACAAGVVGVVLGVVLGVGRPAARPPD